MNTPILGILSIILGGISLIPFCGIFSLFGIILGVLGIVKRQYSTAIIGTVVSGVGIATSPVVWAIMEGGFCKIAHCQIIKSNNVNTNNKVSAMQMDQTVTHPAQIVMQQPAQPIMQTDQPVRQLNSNNNYICHVNISYDVIGAANQKQTISEDIQRDPMNENSCKAGCAGASGKIGGDIKHNTALTMECYYGGVLIDKWPPNH